MVEPNRDQNLPETPQEVKTSKIISTRNVVVFCSSLFTVFTGFLVYRAVTSDDAAFPFFAFIGCFFGIVITATALRHPKTMREQEAMREAAAAEDRGVAQSFSQPTRSVSSQTPGRHREIKPKRVRGVVYLLIGGAFLIVSILSLAGGLFDKEGELIGRVTFLICMAIAVPLLRKSQRYLARGAEAVLARDHRPPVLYLRAFDDDDVTARRVGNRNFLGIPLGIASTEEQQIATLVGRVGPMVAVGRPADTESMVGAARMYLADDEWQGRVLNLMETSTLVLLRAGASEGFWWEVEQALRIVPPERLVILLPFGAATYAVFAERMNKLLPHPLPSFSPTLYKGGTIQGLLWFGPDWKGTVENGPRGKERLRGSLGSPVLYFLEYLLVPVFQQIGRADAAIRNSVARRILAGMIDLVPTFISMLVCFIIFWAIIAYLGRLIGMNSLAGIMIVRWFFLMCAAFVYLATGDLRASGVSLGKRMLNLSVIAEDGSRLRMSRRLVRCITKSIWLSALPIACANDGWVSFLAVLVFAIPTIWNLNVLVGTPRNRMVEDYLSKSFVIVSAPSLGKQPALHPAGG